MRCGEEEEKKKTKRVKRRRRRRNNVRDDQKRRKKLCFFILQFFDVAACELVLRACSCAERNVKGRPAAWDTDWPATWLTSDVADTRTVKFNYKLLTDWLAGWLCGWMSDFSNWAAYEPACPSTNSLTRERVALDRSNRFVCVCVCGCVLWLSFCIIGNETSHCSRDRFLTTTIVPVAPPPHCAIQCRAVSRCDMYI